MLVTTIDEYASERGVIPSIIDGAADRLRPVMLTTLTTVLGLAPLLFERSQQAQFLKPTVITLVYGLGFGMVLVLLLVPSLIAIQHDITRRTGALRRALAAPVASVRLAVAGALAVVVAWLVATMGLTWATGHLPQPFTEALPMLAGASPMMAALGLYLAGALLIVLMVLAGVGLAYLLRRRQPAGQP